MRYRRRYSWKHATGLSVSAKKKIERDANGFRNRTYAAVRNYKLLPDESRDRRSVRFACCATKRVRSGRLLSSIGKLLDFEERNRSRRTFVETIGNSKCLEIIAGRVVGSLTFFLGTIDISRTRRCTNSVVSTRNLARNPS